MDLKPEHHIMGFVKKWVLNQVMARMLLTPLLLELYLELVLVYHIYLLELLMLKLALELSEWKRGLKALKMVLDFIPVYYVVSTFAIDASSGSIQSTALAFTAPL